MSNRKRKSHEDNNLPEHVFRRGERFVVVLDLGRDENGKRKKYWSPSFPSWKAAERHLKTVISRVETGTFVDSSRLTVAQYLDEWLEGARSTIRASTWQSYATHVRAHLKPAFGGKLLQQLRTAQVSAVYAKLLENRSAATVRRIHATLHRALGDAVKSGLLSINPASTARLPKAERAEMSTWTLMELRTFLAATDGTDDSMLWTLLATTGLRRGEALGLRWRDVDLESAVAEIQQTIVTVNHHVEFSKPKTNRGRRRIDLDPETVRRLRRYKAAQTEHRLKAGEAWVDHDLVFTDALGAPQHPGNVSHRFVNAANAARVPRIRLHDLRHTWATLALRAGAHPKVVSDRLGHSTVSITLDVYSHAVPGLQRETAQKIAADIYG
ncbi:MAG: site-specific integrase [Actinomycetota bacterium]